MYKQKIAIVTGANSGMGKASVIALIQKGFHVIMLCRSIGRGLTALNEVESKAGPHAELMVCDLADMESIRRFCRDFRSRYNHIDVLINNAGVITLDRRETKDGLELQFGVNHMGHFLLTTTLLDLFTSGSRIINVGSGAHKVGRIDFNNISLKRGYNVVTAYSRAKLCNLLFTRELARRVADDGIMVNCVHPGAVATNMGVDRDTGFGKTIMALLRPFFRTPEQGAATAVYVATSPECADITGQYFYNQKPAASSRRSRDAELASRLWKLSEWIIKKADQRRLEENLVE